MTKPTYKHLAVFIIMLVIFIFALFNYNAAFALVRRIIRVLTPFAIGVTMAFILNVPLRFMERQVFYKIDNPIFERQERSLTIFLSITIVGGIVYLIGRSIIPQLINSMTLFFANADSYRQELVHFLRVLPDASDNLSSFADQIDALSMEELRENVLNFLIFGADPENSRNVADAVSSTFGILTSVAGGVISGLVAFFFAIYCLASKERLSRQMRKLIYAFFQRNTADYIIHAGQVAFQRFHGFITGQLTEAVILGVLCYMGMKILQMPLAGMVSVLVGFTALIPIAGAFLGGLIGALLIAPYNFIKAVVFVVFLVILQQVEGNLIYPKVVGSSVELPAMWTLFAITVGGTLMGLVGMLLFVPLIATIYSLISEIVNTRLQAKNVPEEAFQIDS